MNKKLKLILIVMLALILGGVGCCYYQHKVSLIFSSPECHQKRVWEIGVYQINEERCSGFIGPGYSYFYLYENEEQIAILPDYGIDLCDTAYMLNFILKNNDTLSLKVNNGLPCYGT